MSRCRRRNQFRNRLPDPPAPDPDRSPSCRSTDSELPVDAPTVPFWAMIVPLIGAFKTTPSTAACADVTASFAESTCS